NVSRYFSARALKYLVDPEIKDRLLIFLRNNVITKDTYSYYAHINIPITAALENFSSVLDEDVYALLMEELKKGNVGALWVTRQENYTSEALSSILTHIKRYNNPWGWRTRYPNHGDPSYARYKSFLYEDTDRDEFLNIINKTKEEEKNIWRLLYLTNQVTTYYLTDAKLRNHRDNQTAEIEVESIFNNPELIDPLSSLKNIEPDLLMQYIKNIISVETLEIYGQYEMYASLLSTDAAFKYRAYKEALRTMALANKSVVIKLFAQEGKLMIWDIDYTYSGVEMNFPELTSLRWSDDNIPELKELLNSEYEYYRNAAQIALDKIAAGNYDVVGGTINNNSLPINPRNMPPQGPSTSGMFSIMLPMMFVPFGMEQVLDFNFGISLIITGVIIAGIIFIASKLYKTIKRRGPPTAITWILVAILVPGNTILPVTATSTPAQTEQTKISLSSKNLQQTDDKGAISILPSEKIVIFVLDSGIDTALVSGDRVIGDLVYETSPGHGTLIARIIYDKCPECLIYSLKLLKTSETSFSQQDFVSTLGRVLSFVKDHPDVRVVLNVSSGNYTYNSEEHELIKELYKEGVIIVAACGNNNVSLPQYPAAYEEVIAVGAMKNTWEKADYSNYGDYVDISDIDAVITIMERIDSSLRVILGRSLGARKGFEQVFFPKIMTYVKANSYDAKVEQFEIAFNDFKSALELGFLELTPQEKADINNLFNLIDKMEASSGFSREMLREDLMFTLDLYIDKYGYDYPDAVKEKLMLSLRDLYSKNKIMQLFEDVLSGGVDVSEIQDRVWNIEREELWQLTRQEEDMLRSIEKLVEIERLENGINEIFVLLPSIIENQFNKSVIQGFVEKVTHLNDDMMKFVIDDSSLEWEIVTSLDELTSSIRAISQLEVTQAGTSFTAPAISGLVGKILSINSQLTPNLVAKIIMENADSGALGVGKLMNYDRTVMKTKTLLKEEILEKEEADSLNAFIFDPVTTSLLLTSLWLLFKAYSIISTVVGGVLVGVVVYILIKRYNKKIAEDQEQVLNQVGSEEKMGTFWKRNNSGIWKLIFIKDSQEMAGELPQIQIGTNNSDDTTLPSLSRRRPLDMHPITLFGPSLYSAVPLMFAPVFMGIGTISGIAVVKAALIAGIIALGVMGIQKFVRWFAKKHSAPNDKNTTENSLVIQKQWTQDLSFLYPEMQVYVSEQQLNALIPGAGIIKAFINIFEKYFKTANIIIYIIFTSAFCYLSPIRADFQDISAIISIIIGSLFLGLAF
ncbi:MAG: S8 family serine peptidase, partial [Candidatus Njordarchaeales archaeon]